MLEMLPTDEKDKRIFDEIPQFFRVRINHGLNNVLNIQKIIRMIPIAFILNPLKTTTSHNYQDR